MLFDSAEFMGFFGVFLLLYYFVRGSLRARNVLIVLGSFIFYGTWDWRFLLLMIATATFDFGIALKIDPTKPRRARQLLVSSLAANLGVLFYFKYCGFFVESFCALCASIGWQLNAEPVRIILPIGISFYTFQSMSYVIDVYRQTISPSRHWVEFLAYIAFFPQLVAGPIERAAHLLPQFQMPRLITAEHLRSGVALILFGFFKKIVIADNLAPFVQLAYEHPDPGALLIVAGTIAFGFQIYCDFSGYSDIARGTAAVLGFDLMRNFNAPYCATDLADFWRRWHISLSTWFRDYLYIPLGGNRRGPARACFNLFIVMFLAGLWHGARINFVLWGCWHALGLIAFKLWQKTRPNWLKLPSVLSWLATMCWVFFGWLLFRVDSIDTFYRCLTALANASAPFWLHLYLWNLALLCLPLFLWQLWERTRSLDIPLPRALATRAVFQGALLLGILLFAQREEIRPFIYFQF